MTHQQLEEAYTYKVNAAQERGDDALTAEMADDYMTHALSELLGRAARKVKIGR